jgi:Asp-tRNA(Asn)/Glu-tRNA(Gln) amidotransferase A subunit family amidase
MKKTRHERWSIDDRKVVAAIHKPCNVNRYSMMTAPSKRHKAATQLLVVVTLAILAMSGAVGQEGIAMHELSAARAAELIRSGEISSVELIEVLLDRIERHRSLNAFVTIDRRAVIGAARRADRAIRSGANVGPLTGVPIVVKDNINTAGLATTAGTPALRQFVPNEDAPVVARLVAAGAIILGKTNMHELAFGITSNNAHFGAVGNAYDPSRFAGGSSGGSAAAIAARLAPAGLGTDTGGSVRIPAALNGISGLRPTIDRYQQSGIVPISITRDTAGPMARSVADLVLLDNVITGYDQPIRPLALSTIRIGLPGPPFWDDLDTETRALAEGFVARLRERGVTVVDVDTTAMAELVEMAESPIPLYEVRRDLTRYLDEYVDGVTFESLVSQIASPDVQAIFAAAIVGDNAMSDEIYREAMEIHRPALQRLYAHIFASHELDAIVFPTTRLPARPIEESDMLIHNGREQATFPTFVANTSPGSIAGIPGLTIPIGLTRAGLPVGIEFDGPVLSDRRLLAIGLAMEALLDPIPPPD